MADAQHATPESNAREVPAAFTYHGRADTPAHMSIVEHPKPKRVARALKALGTCWGLAIVSVFLPVLHFLLVPGFLIAGPYLALQRLAEKATLFGASGTCPACGHELGFKVREPLRDRTSLRCTACSREIWLVPGEGALTQG